MAAIKNGREEIAFELVELGADLTLCDQDGMSAVSWAEKKGLVPFLDMVKARDCLNGEASTEQGDCRLAS